MRDSIPTFSMARGPMLDANAFPHLFDAVISHLDCRTLIRVRLLSKRVQDAADSRLFSHLVILVRGDGAVLVRASRGPRLLCDFRSLRLVEWYTTPEDQYGAAEAVDPRLERVSVIPPRVSRLLTRAHTLDIAGAWSFGRLHSAPVRARLAAALASAPETKCVRFIPDPYGRHECGPHATTPTTVVRACPLEDEMLYALAARAGRRVVVLTLLAPPLSSRKRSTPQQAQVQPLNIDGSYATARAVALLSRSGCTVVGLECLPPATMPYWGPSHVAFRRAVSIIAANSDAAREIAATRTGITWSQERGGVVYCPHAVCGDDESARAVAVPAADVDVAVRVEKDGIPRQSKRPISARSLTRWWERICCWLFR